MQVDLRITPTKAFFFQTSAVFFPSFLKCYAIFQDQSEDCIGEDEIVDMIESLYLVLVSLCYIVFKQLHHIKFCENQFFPSL